MNKQALRNFLEEAGYSERDIDLGFEYAEEKGYSSIDQLGQLVLSRILYDDRQLADGELVGWEPVTFMGIIL